MLAWESACSAFASWSLLPPQYGRLRKPFRSSAFPPPDRIPYPLVEVVKCQLAHHLEHADPKREAGPSGDKKDDHHGRTCRHYPPAEGLGYTAHTQVIGHRLGVLLRIS